MIPRLLPGPAPVKATGAQTSTVTRVVCGNVIHVQIIRPQKVPWWRRWRKP